LKKCRFYTTLYVVTVFSRARTEARVEVSPRELRTYETPSGACPFEEWLNGLRDAKGRARIRVRLDRIEEGNLGDCKSVGKGVRELRIDFGPGYRVYFAEDGPIIVLLLIGGDKSTQRKDIETAMKYWSEYQGVNDARTIPKLQRKPASPAKRQR
jgi:putative addiction module killer protein